MSHSQLPWVTTMEAGVSFILDADRRKVTSNKPFCQSAPCDSDREFIVKAVNSHYEMLEALKVIVSLDHHVDCPAQYANGYECDCPSGDIIYKAYAAAQSAINKVEGE